MHPGEFGLESILWRASVFPLSAIIQNNSTPERPRKRLDGRRLKSNIQQAMSVVAPTDVPKLPGDVCYSRMNGPSSDAARGPKSIQADVGSPFLLPFKSPCHSDELHCPADAARPRRPIGLKPTSNLREGGRARRKNAKAYMPSIKAMGGTMGIAAMLADQH